MAWLLDTNVLSEGRKNGAMKHGYARIWTDDRNPL